MSGNSSGQPAPTLADGSTKKQDPDDFILITAFCSRRGSRVDSLRKADLSRGTSPRAFGGVLLARFDVRVDPAEQKELVALLEDEV